MTGASTYRSLLINNLSILRSQQSPLTFHSNEREEVYQSSAYIYLSRDRAHETCNLTVNDGSSNLGWERLFLSSGLVKQEFEQHLAGVDLFMIQTLLLVKCKLSDVSSQSSHGQPNAKIGFSNSVTSYKTIKQLKSG